MDLLPPAEAQAILISVRVMISSMAIMLMPTWGWVAAYPPIMHVFVRETRCSISAAAQGMTAS